MQLFEEYDRVGRFELDFPDLRQTENFDCGAVALQGVLIYYGVDVREGDLLKLLGTTSVDIVENGTKMSSMLDVARHYGFKAEVRREMKIEEMLGLVEGGVPVIMLMQAWRDYSKNAEWKADEDDGHYVVAIGKEGNNVIIEDPSLTVRGWVGIEELDERWHGIDDDETTEVNHAGVVVFGRPEYDSSHYVHID